MERKPNVYIASDPGHDFSDAKRFGRVVNLIDGRPNVFALGYLIRRLKQGLEGSVPDDYIIATGSTISTAIAAFVLVLAHGRINLLIWSHRDEQYTSRLLRIEQLKSPEASD